MSARWWCSALAAMVVVAGSSPGRATSVLDVRVSGGGEQRAVLERPAGPARATLVMLPGGAGDLGIDASGFIAHGDNFLVRTAGLWTERGFAVLLPDALDGRNLRGLRSTPAYGAVVEDLVAAARAAVQGPVFLIGTSQGSIAATNGAAHLRGGEIAGVVLTESVSREGGSHETVFDADPGRIAVPALIVANQDDQCEVAPPEDAPAIAAAMTGTHAEVITVQGGRAGRNPCGSLSAHGYDGIETQVVDIIATWLDRHR